MSRQCVCGFRIRGNHHDDGGHHAGNSNNTTGAAAKCRIAKRENSGLRTNIGDPNHPTSKSRFPAEYARYHQKKSRFG